MVVITLFINGYLAVLLSLASPGYSFSLLHNGYWWRNGHGVGKVIIFRW